MTWEKKFCQYGTYFTLVIILLGLVCLWQRYRSNALVCQLGLVALGLHASQVLKTSDSGIQLADRASAVLYVAVSAALAVFIVQFWPTRHLHWYHVLMITVTIHAPVYGWLCLVGWLRLWCTTQPLRGWSRFALHRHREHPGRDMDTSLSRIE